MLSDSALDGQKVTHRNMTKQNILISEGAFLELLNAPLDIISPH